MSALVSPVVRVGVGCFVLSQQYPNCVLFGRRLASHGSGKLALPGGHLELTETWEACALREVKEETNLDVTNLKFVHVTNDPSIGGDFTKHYVTIFMSSVMSPSSAPLINLEPNKCEKWDWVTWDEIIRIYNNNREQLFDPMIHFIETNKNKDFLTI